MFMLFELYILLNDQLIQTFKLIGENKSNIISSNILLTCELDVYRIPNKWKSILIIVDKVISQTI